MSDDQTVEIEIVDDGVGDDDDVDTYELDADETAEIDVESVMQDALEAVSKDAPEEPRTAETDSARIEELEAALARAEERAVRSLADLENFRKRADRERQEERKNATGELLREILPVIDNLERALAADGSVEDLRAGVELILKEVESLFARRGVVRVAAVGEPFDPTVHEAVSRHEDPGVTRAEVSEQFQSGYLWRDRLLRPAVVKVVMPPEGSKRQPSDDN